MRWLLLALLTGCVEGHPCPEGQALANAGDCVPGCALYGGYGEPVFDDVGMFTGECRFEPD
jgi:hypothetical protein